MNERSKDRCCPALPRFAGPEKANHAQKNSDQQTRSVRLADQPDSTCCALGKDA